MERGKLGLIVNPVAGLGGSVGLKGTDHVAAEALRRGAVPQAERRAADALARLLPLREQITVYTGRGPLGAVSYTHLDVYKRQAQDRPQALSHRPQLRRQHDEGV